MDNREPYIYYTSIVSFFFSGGIRRTPGVALGAQCLYPNWRGACCCCCFNVLVFEFMVFVFTSNKFWSL